MSEQTCGCWRNPETGYLEACERHDPVFMEYAMTIGDLRTKSVDLLRENAELLKALAESKRLEAELRESLKSLRFGLGELGSY